MGIRDSVWAAKFLSVKPSNHVKTYTNHWVVLRAGISIQMILFDAIFVILSDQKMGTWFAFGACMQLDLS